jgi:hypothetical protein
MAKHLVFLVHGMGSFKKDWSADISKRLVDLYSSYAALKPFPFSDFFEFKEIVYDGEFEALRTLWRNSTEALGTAIKTFGISVELVEELNKLASATNRDTFLNTHVADVLMYRALRQVAGMVRDSVRLQILNALTAGGDLGLARWSIIAHSLGTSVIHDSLQGLYTDSSVNRDANFTGVTRPMVLAMIANVSRVLEDGGNFDVYTSRVVPGVDANAGCTFYLNARHEWDPFTQPKKFAPMSDWPSMEVRARELYVECAIRDIAQVDVHALDHYLNNPLVHGPLFNSLLGFPATKGPLDAGTIATAHGAYVNNIDKQILDAALAKLKPIRLGEEDKWSDIIKSWQAMLKLAKSLP